jgi:predicted DNA-binding protein with PD1-like motif
MPGLHRYKGVYYLSVRYELRRGKGEEVIVTRLKPGSDLLASLKDIASSQGIRGGVFLSGVGLLEEAHLRNCKILPDTYPITDENRTFLSFKVPLEILSMSGNISISEGEPLVHVHLTLSHATGEGIKVIGGHLLEGCIVFGFAEIVILVLSDIQMIKQFDEETKTPQLF